MRRLLAGEIDGPLDLAAAQLAGIEIPDFDPAPVIAQLDSLAQQLDAACPRGASGKQFVAAANRLFFETLGYTGNQADYYDPRNSFLHQVLDRRSGMPITLSVIYMEVARRAGRAVHGIGLPGHFIVQYSDADWSAFIDPFHGGRLLTRRDCEQLVRERTGLGSTTSSA